MNRNLNRHRSAGFVNQLLAYALVAICATGSLGLGKVWLSHQISVAANANKVLQSQLAEMQRRLDEIGVEIAAEEDPAVLTRRNETWRLGLAAPADAQVRRVTIDPVRRLAALHNRALFGERPMISFLGVSRTEDLSGRHPAGASASPGVGDGRGARPVPPLSLGARAAPPGIRLAFAR
jgi:hypothetical protein